MGHLKWPFVSPLQFINNAINDISGIKVPHIVLEKMNAMESMLLACWGWNREVGRNDVILSETESALSF